MSFIISRHFSGAITLALLMLFLPDTSMAAPPTGGKANPTRPQVGQPVTAHSINVDLRNLPKAKPWIPGMGISEAHRRQYTPIGSKAPHAPADKPTASDRLPELQNLWDKSPSARRARAAITASNRVSINNPNTGVSPGDPVVEVGANHVIYAVNSGGSGTYFNVYNKSGTLVSGPITFGSLAPAGNSCTSDRGDPLVHYDRQAGRWFMLTMDDTGLCTFVSKTSDPVSGGWWFYRYATLALPDYPHCGVWSDAYVCSTNEGSQVGTEIYAFDRANMLTGATARAAQRFNSVANLAGYGFQIMTPSTFYGSIAAPAGRKQLLARHNDDEAHAGGSANGTQDYIDLYELNIDWNTPTNSGITALPRIVITEFNSWFRNYSTFATVPQPGSTSRLDPIREVLLNQLVYRNLGTHEAIVGTLATNQNPARTGTIVDSGIRWFELRRVGAGAWALHQEGTFSPGDTSTHHLMGTAAMDKFGNIGMGYNVTKTTAPTKFATLGYTGRTPSDPVGVMSLGENQVAVGAAVETSGRWGDYYQMTVDPVDDCTFWFVGMYRPAGSWQTRIQDFKFPSCVNPPNLAFRPGLGGAWYNLNTSGQGFGIDIDSSVGYIFGGWYTYAVNGGTGGNVQQEQRWYTLQGNFVPGETTKQLPVLLTTGGTFDSPPITQATAVGTATLSFQGCDTGRLDYQINVDGQNRNGSIPLTRLGVEPYCASGTFPTLSLSQSGINPSLNGAWYDPNTSGQGFQFVFLPSNANTAFLFWYTYDVNGVPSSGPSGQRWYTIQGNYTTGNSQVSNLPILQATGGRFEVSPPSPTTAQVGTADIVFHSCTSASLTYRFNSGLTRTISLSKLVGGGANCAP